MIAPSLSIFPFLLGTLLFGIPALLLLKSALLPKRRGGDPHCRRCDYLLVNLTSGTCPECGLGLTPENVVHGRRARRPGLAVLGSLLLLPALASLAFVISPELQSKDWYRYAPTGYVLRELESSNPFDFNRAWTEIARRDKLGRLSAGDKSKVVDAALDQLAAPTPISPSLTFDVVAAAPSLTPGQSDKLVNLAVAELAAPRPLPLRQQVLDLVGRQVEKDALTPAQVDRFFTACVNSTIEVRPKVLAGEEVPYTIRHGAGGPTGFWPALMMGPKRLDGREVQPAGGSSSSNSFGGGATGSWVKTTDAGPHELEVDVTHKVIAGKHTGNYDVPARWQRTITHRARFEVVPATESTVAGFKDDALAEPIRKSIRVDDAHCPDWRESDLGLMIRFDNPPADLAFDVLARVAGREHPVGTLTMRKGVTSSTHVHTDTFPPGPVPAVDLVFRSSPKVARRTTDMTSFWDGVVEIEDVPVTPRKR